MITTSGSASTVMRTVSSPSAALPMTSMSCSPSSAFCMPSTLNFSASAMRSRICFGSELLFRSTVTPHAPAPRASPRSLRQAERGERRRPQVEDHPADVLERLAQLRAERRELGEELGADLGRRAVGDALEELDLEDRVRQHLGRTVVYLPVQALPLVLDPLEHGHGERARLVIVAGRRAKTRQERQRGRDVRGGELELLQPRAGFVQQLHRRRIVGARDRRERLVRRAVVVETPVQLLETRAHRVGDLVEARVEIVRERYGVGLHRAASIEMKYSPKWVASASNGLRSGQQNGVVI